ncbi:Putative lipase ATG15 [Psilocybe cubensis]|uniref:Lipase ATG15 n=2 Tax=Psilocybe cubensis TaxID=181762 RepID=A0ACB8H9W6_PSICU|nr:Putative lipase ATG15 [Psilocybe cubensis]KAH9484457.1 Putative lipase ATG15 [Psilocybe cubensis]
MPSTTLMLAALLLLPSVYANQQISFTSHRQFDLQHPDHLPLTKDNDGAQNTYFNPTNTYPLPSQAVHLKSQPTLIYRPRSVDVLHRTRLRSLQHAESGLEPVLWDLVEVEGPAVEDLHTLSQLARMSGNAYALPGQKNWYEVDHAWNRSFPFGWEESDGFRGHVFQSSDNSTIVLSIKGTTLQGPTSKLDKFNDNLLFSCCCARVDISWVFSTVCDCYAKNFRCDNQCLTDALIQDSLFYSIGVKLIDDLLKIYPGANVWLVGHSLGGSLASLLGATYGLPAVAFESPGERLAATRLHLPLPPPMSAPPLPSPVSTWKFGIPHIKFPFPFPGHSPSNEPSIPIPTTPAPPPRLPAHHIATTHVYHNADPIPQGACTGIGSPCAQAGFALETRCHLGQTILFDTVNKLGWGVDVRKHVIREVVTKVLEGDVWWGEDDDEPDGNPEDGQDDEDDDWTIIKSFKNKKGKHKDKKGREGPSPVPKPFIEEDCVECFKWEFGDFKDREKDVL